MDAQNRYHFGRNEFCVAPLLNPPKLCWFPDNGPEPANYVNRLVEISNINSWIKEFNVRNGITGLPSFQTFGTRKSKKVLSDGSSWDFKTHRWNEWRWSEPHSDKLHLNDTMRGKMGRSVVKKFEGEIKRKGHLV